MTLDIVLVVIGALLMIGGIAGCFLPVLPGMEMSLAGIVCMEFTSKIDFSWQFYALWIGIIVLVEILNYIVPIWGTKRFGGGKYGTWGCTIGVIVGLFFGPWGIVLGPFVGAVIGEFIAHQNVEVSFKAGFGAFVGFLAGTLMQLVVCMFLLYYFVKAAIALWS